MQKLSKIASDRSSGTTIYNWKSILISYSVSYIGVSPDIGFGFSVGLSRWDTWIKRLHDYTYTWRRTAAEHRRTTIAYCSALYNVVVRMRTALAAPVFRYVFFFFEISLWTLKVLPNTRRHVLHIFIKHTQTYIHLPHTPGWARETYASLILLMVSPLIYIAGSPIYSIPIFFCVRTLIFVWRRIGWTYLQINKYTKNLHAKHTHKWYLFVSSSSSSSLDGLLLATSKRTCLFSATLNSSILLIRKLKYCSHSPIAPYNK